MRTRQSVLAFTAALLLAGCISVLEGPPTPEPFVPPPSPTARVGGAATSTPADNAAGTPAATSDSSATQTPEAPAVTYTVQRGDVVEALMLNGVVISSQRQSLTFAQAGQLKALAVNEPGPVKKGELIADLDTADLDAQLADAQLAYQRAKSAYDRSLAAADLPARKAEIDLATARDALEKARRPATPEEIATAQAAVQRAQALLAKVRNDASALKSQAQLTFQTAEKKLLTAQAEYGAAAQAHEADKDDQAANQRFLDASAALREAEQEYSKAKIDLDTALGNEIALIQEAEAQVKETQAALETLRKLPDPFAVKEAQRAVQQAELALAQARTQAVADPELQIRLEEAQKALDAINTQFEARRLYAPFDGEVVEINAKAGALLQPGDPVVTILNPNISADAREIQLAQVDPSVNISQGQAVSVLFADSGDKLVPGTVSRILGDAASGTRVAYIALEAPGQTLAPGAPATVALELSRRAATLWLPPPAIRNDGRSFVIVMDAGKQSRVNIDLGITGLGRVEILNGLSEGQVVVGE